MGYFWVYGGIFTIMSIGFYIYDLGNSTIYTSTVKQFFKFLFSLCTGWLFVICILGADGVVYSTNKITELFFITIFYIFPIIIFLGFQMLLYGLFEEE